MHRNKSLVLFLASVFAVVLLSGCAKVEDSKPLVAANNPSSQKASPDSGGLPHPAAIESGRNKQAATITTRWMTTDLRPGA